MGFKISWIAFHGIGRNQVLDRMGLRDTGEADRENESPLSGAEIPDGWFIVFSNDVEFISPKRLASLSRDCRVVACQVHEGVMFSRAFFYERGVSSCEITHDSDKGIYDLSISGSPPPEFGPVRDRLMREQEQDGGENADVDHVFDIPVETAAAICGYRHDRWKYDWGEPQFSRLAFQ